VGCERFCQGEERVGRTQRLVSRHREKSTALRADSREYDSLICQLLEWEKVLRHSTRETNEKPAMANRADEHPDPSFAKREAEELDEQMKARRSKRRKSEPDCAVVEQG